MPHDPDPLLAFFAEPATVNAPESPQPVTRTESAEPAESAGKPAQSAVTAQDPPGPATALENGDANADLGRRLARAERLLDRSLVEITALKSDLATIVTSLDDIRKLKNRVETSPVHAVPPAARTSRTGPVLTAVVMVAAVALGWGVMSIASGDVLEPPQIESTPEPTSSPAPVGDVAPPRVDLELPPSAAVVAAPAVATLDRKVQPVRDPPARAPARPVAGYVGTLTIDATPAGEVFLNRKSVGRTPVRLENLRAGSHLIWIEREGYRRWTRVVAVVADRISRVSATLDSLSR